jgi:prevent-host-death family protein
VEWRLAEAKNRFSELVNTALAQGPQTVRRRGDAVVVIAEQEYQRLIGTQPGFRQHLLHPPAGLAEIDLSRDRSPMRDAAL